MEGICFSSCSLKLTTVIQWYLRWVIVLDREDVEVHLHAAQTKTEHFCMGKSSWKIASLLGNNTWTTGCTWLPKISTQSLAVIRPCTGAANARYCCPNHHRSGSMFHSWNQAFRIIGFLGWCPNINPAWCLEQHEGWLIWPYHVFPIIRWPGCDHHTIFFTFWRCFQ